ncbi:hypothetical protein Ancab_038346, partial [Ancistrocladus abbreviatus]
MKEWSFRGFLFLLLCLLQLSSLFWTEGDVPSEQVQFLNLISASSASLSFRAGGAFCGQGVGDGYVPAKFADSGLPWIVGFDGFSGSSAEVSSMVFCRATVDLFGFS